MTAPVAGRSTRVIARICAAALAACCCANAASQAYPNRPVRFIVPHAAGGANDIIARVIAPQLGENLGQQVVVDNRAGGSAIIGTTALARSPADGYTIMLADVPHAANPALNSKLPYDTLKDFIAIVQVAQMPSLLIVHPAFPVNSVEELVRLARAKPGQINYASAGAGSSIYLTMQLFISRTGIDLFHVPYKSGAPALADVIGGQVPMEFVTTAAGISPVRAGRVRALGVTSAKRIAALPDTPTIAEQGLPGFEDYFWQGVIAPAGVPAEIVAKLNAEINRALASRVVQERISGLGADIVGGTPERLQDFIRAQVESWSRIIKPGARVD